MTTNTLKAVNCFANNKGFCNHPTSGSWMKRCPYLDHQFTVFCRYWESRVRENGVKKETK